MNLNELLKKYNIKSTPCYSFVGDGWIPLLDKMFQELISLGWDKDLDQVKEKFGCLRVYIGNTTAEISKVIEKAEADSSVTCEECGNPGELRTSRSWFTTLCDTCESQRKK